MSIVTELPLSVIIPTYKRPNAVKRTLEVMCSFLYRPAEIILVDQTEDQEIRHTNEYLLRSKCPNGKYIFAEKPSLTASRNIGLKAATYDVVVFMDDDVDVNENTLVEIANRMQDESISMIGVLDEFSMGEKQGKLGYFFGMKSYKNRNMGHVTLAMLGRYPAEVRGEVPTMWAMGYCFVIRKHLAEKWDLKFDEQLVGYAFPEDMDFTFAYYKCALKENLDCILSEKITVKHLGTKEYRIPQRSHMYKYVINRTYLGYKHNTGISGQLMILWSNIGYFLFMLRNKMQAITVLQAQIECERIRKYLRNKILVGGEYS